MLGTVRFCCTLLTKNMHNEVLFVYIVNNMKSSKSNFKRQKTRGTLLFHIVISC